MAFRQLWWFAVVLWVNTVSADDGQLCPCVLPHHCSGSEKLEANEHPSTTPCEDPGTVRCCLETSSRSTRSEPIQMITEHLKKEQEFVAAIDSIMKEVQQISSIGENREDKSLGGTSKNSLDNDKKQSDTSTEDNKKAVKNSTTESVVSDLQTLTNKSNNLSESISLENDQANSTREVRNDEKAKNNLIIVYPEKSSKNNTNEKKNPHIVYPSNVTMEEYLQSEETTIHEQKTPAKDSKQENETLDKQDSVVIRNPQSSSGKSNLRKLFPRRNPPLKSYTAQNKPDDLGEAGSEVEEVKTTAPSNVPSTQVEQILNRKPFRSPPRLHSRKPVASDVNSQISGEFEPQRETKIRTGLPALNHNNINKNAHNVPAQDHTATVMDEINLKVINDAIKTNFTRPSFVKRPRPNMRPPHLQFHTNSNAMSPLAGRIQQEKKSLPQSGNLQATDSSTSLDQKQSKTAENTDNTEHVANSSVAAAKGERFNSRRRNRFRTQNVNLPTKFSTTVSMSQEQAFDTLKESKPQDSLKRRQPYRRLKLKSEVSTSNVDTSEQATTTQPEPSTFRRRSKFQPRTYIESTSQLNPSSSSKPTEENKSMKTPESNINHSDSQQLNQNVNTAPSVPSTQPEELKQADAKFEGDLESSGSEVKPQRVRVRGRFFPPQTMETGFQPMFGSRNLNVVGPIPGGFQDRARGFSDADQIGLELPRANFQSQFDEGDQFQFDAEEETEKPLALLPPVFPVSQPAISSIGPTSVSQTSTDTVSGDEKLSLLPPVETPKSVEAIGLMLDQHRDITQLNQEFNQLKNRYDMLLNRYAETLKTYNDKYRNLFSSTDGNKK